MHGSSEKVIRTVSHTFLELFYLASLTVLDEKNRDTPGGVRNVLHLGAPSVPSWIGGERMTRTYLTVTR